MNTDKSQNGPGKNYLCLSGPICGSNSACAALLFHPGLSGFLARGHARARGAAWAGRGGVAGGWSCDVMIETHDSLFTAAAIGRFLAVAPDAAILWDAHHTWRKGGEDPLVTWRAIRGSVPHVHVKDSIGVPSARHPFTYVLPGDGEFPMAPLMAVLRADNFAGPVSLEWEKMWHPYLAPLDEALATATARGWWPAAPGFKL